jgi:hypothetical protein
MGCGVCGGVGCVVWAVCGGVGCVGCGGCGGVGCGWCGGVGSLLTFDIPQTALVATLDTYDFIIIILNRGRSIDLFRILPKWSLDGVTHRGLVPACC